MDSNAVWTCSSDHFRVLDHLAYRQTRPDDRLDRISDQVKDEDTHRLRRIRITHPGDDPSVDDGPIDRLRRIVTIRMAVDHQAVGIIGRHARHDRICIHTDIRHDRTPAIGR